MKSIIAIISLLFFMQEASAMSVNLLLRGTVPRVLELEINNEIITSNLPLNITQNNVLIAQVIEKSNSNTGYTISITSVNQGRLVHETNPLESIVYTLQYNGQPVNLTSPQTFLDLTKGRKTRDLTISYIGIEQESMLEGQYSDNITFSITAN